MSSAAAVPDGAPALAVEELVAGYGGVIALDGVSISAGTGAITVKYSAATAQISGATMILTPSVGGVQLATAGGGNIDWACESVTSTTAASFKLPVTGGATILARYVPTQCK